MTRLFKPPKPPTGDLLPRPTNASLEKLLGMLQDGDLPVLDDDVMAEIVCELLELRAWKAKNTIKFKGAEIIFDDHIPDPPDLMRLMEERIEKAQREMGQKMNEDLQRNFYGGGLGQKNKLLEQLQQYQYIPEQNKYYQGYDRVEVKLAWRWENDIQSDHEYLVDPDGNRCATVSGIQLMQCKDAKQIGAMKHALQKQAEKSYMDRKRREGILGMVHH